MAGYSDTRKMIIDALMGRPEGTQIQPEDHQAFALQIIDYIRSVELVAGNATPIGFADADTVPVQPYNGQAVYLSSVSGSNTITFTNFIDQNGNAISVASTANVIKLITLLWNGQYWSSQVTSVNAVRDTTDGYLFMGVATLETTPGTPDQKVFYIADGKGVYTNFDGISVTEDEVVILYYDTAWHKEVTGIASNDKLTKLESKVNTKIAVLEKGVIYDVTENNNNATFASLSALLSDENLSTLIPVDVRSGGMSIRFVQSSDNKYVQWRLVSKDWNTDVNNWVAENEDFRNRVMQEVNTAVASIKPIEVTGDVTNAPDEEDLTSVNVGGTDVLKFKDKPYTPLTYSGMGRKILRKNIVDGVNTLTQSMMSDANTIYVIQYDFDLGGASIEIPENCILEFNGGSISNGVIVGANTMFECGQQYTFKENVTFRGTYTTTWLSPCNFGAKGCNVNVSNSYVITYTDKYDSTVAINNAFASGFNIEFPAGIFYITNTLIIKKRGINIKLQGDSCESVGSSAFIREDYYYDKKANNSNQTVIFVEGGFNVFNVQTSQVSFKGGVIDCRAITKSINPSHICFNLDLTYDISDCVFNTFILGNSDIQNGYCTTGYFVDCVKIAKAPYNNGPGFLTGCTFDGRVSYCSKAFYIPKNPKVISGDNGNVNTWDTWITSNDLLFDSFMCRQSHVLYCGLVFRIKGSHQSVALFNEEERYTISPIELAVNDVYLDAIMWDYSGVKTNSGLCTSYYIISTPYISDYKSYRYIASPQANNITFSPNIRDNYYRQIPNNVIKENNLITDEKGLGLRCVEDFIWTTYDTIHYNTLRRFNRVPSSRVTVTGYTEDGTIDNDYFSINTDRLFRLGGASIKFNKTKSELVNYENHYIDIKITTPIYYSWVVGYNIHAGYTVLLPKNIEILFDNEVIDSKEIFENRNKFCFKNWFKFNKSGDRKELIFRFKGLKNIDNASSLEIKIYDLFVVSPDYYNDALDYITWSSTANRPKGIDCRLNFDTDLRSLLMYSSNYGFWLTSDGYVPYKKTGFSNSIPDTLSSYNIGAPFYNQTTNKTIFWGNGKWMDFDGVEYNAVRSGTFENKPTTAQKIYIGFAYFCTDRKTTEGSTDGIMIYHKGDNVWVDALGRVVS